jgi:hypothetical protein
MKYTPHEDNTMNLLKLFVSSGLQFVNLVKMGLQTSGFVSKTSDFLIDLVITPKTALYVGIITVLFLVILSFFPSKSEEKLVIFIKIYSGFSAKLVLPPLDVAGF